MGFAVNLNNNTFASLYSIMIIERYGIKKIINMKSLIVLQSASIQGLQYRLFFVKNLSKSQNLVVNFPLHLYNIIYIEIYIT